jgi:hypothetical protein
MIAIFHVAAGDFTNPSRNNPPALCQAHRMSSRKEDRRNQWQSCVNGTPLQNDEYQRSFDLPNKEQLVLAEPLKFYIYLPCAVLAAIDEWSSSKEIWFVAGRVYLFGKFKKGIFSFKRCIPIELNFTIRNPLRTNP